MRIREEGIVVFISHFKNNGIRLFELPQESNTSQGIVSESVISNMCHPSERVKEEEIVEALVVMIFKINLL
jgi:hypothetical protein